ncbi:Na+/H+ antiporter [Microbacterium hominis]|uniref:Na+/H+ antiporter n=1 Tax=Microbacterium hominis TaxID=162426 RepID=A0A2K9DEE6_9MICO|nr:MULTISPECIES: Na+/H+ antiporter [Microbacterium]AUG30521.1 Na+/H+ antiporter [Microbacterium hominis]QOC26283.1 Na+/H+ antiporter [Microbacterium hominis]QOC30234.1 Na+/H+ antiporter [Microbacterium hominis]QRY41805.1 Na+/H+ antiporter [Microbacterium hominis]QYF97412.1 Na+/H+ antiporter [Microbacterium sp. PAMC21962]
MEGLEVTVLLGLAVLAGTILAPRLRVATPLVLLVIGLLLGFVPALRQIELPPETVLLLFLPVMLFWESLTTSLRGVRRSLRYIIPMSTLLVVASAFAVAWVATMFGLPWPAAMILGAAVAPPDATAVAALGRLLPQRTFMKLKAESLTNDGTALVLYAIAISVALGDTVTGWSITATVLMSYLGGAAAGIAVAALAYVSLRRMRNALSINVTLLLVPFTAFLLAELVNASGVLAVVFAGLIIAWASPRITTAASRRTATAAWPFGVYLLNGALFVLIGLEVQLVLHEISPGELWGLVLLTIAAWAALLVVRYVFQLLVSPFSRPRTPGLSARTGPGSLNRARIVSTVAGFRGAVSLAIALSVPLTTSAGDPLTGRDAVVFVTAGVIVLSLLVQGPLLPAVVRWAQLPSDEWAADELELAQRTITGAAIAALDDIAAEHGISDEVRERARRDGYDMLELANARAFARAQAASDADQIAQLEGMVAAPSAPDTGAQAVVDAAASPAEAASESVTALTMLAASTGIDLTQRSPLTRFEEMTRLKLALLDRKREVLLRLRREGTVDDLLARRLEAHLDAEELRLSGFDDLD